MFSTLAFKAFQILTPFQLSLHSYPHQTELLPTPSAGWSTTSPLLICALFYKLLLEIQPLSNLLSSFFSSFKMHAIMFLPSVNF